MQPKQARQLMMCLLKSPSVAINILHSRQIQYARMLSVDRDLYRITPTRNWLRFRLAEAESLVSHRSYDYAPDLNLLNGNTFIRLAG